MAIIDQKPADPLTRGAGVRPLTRADIGRITELHARAFSHGRPRSGLDDFLADLFFHHPWRDDSCPSLGYVDPEGALVGCLGCMPRPMTFDGRPIRVIVGHDFIVDRDHRNGLPAIKMLQGLLRCGADLVVSETNAEARPIAESLGGRIVEARSRRWLRALRPAGLAAHLVSERRGRPRAARGLRALAAVPDALALRVPGSPVRRRSPPGAVVPLSGPLLAELVDRTTAHAALRPVYDRRSAGWLLATLRKTRRAQTLVARAVRDGGRFVGWYVYYSRPGAVGRVLQLGAYAETRGRVLDHLLEDALREGNVALSGKSDPFWDDQLTSVACAFRSGRSWFTAFAADPLVDVLESPRAFFGRLEGEGWLRFGY